MNSKAVFWADMAPCEHLVQFYEDDAAFLDTLEGFVADGLIAREGVVVIATPSHLSSLHRRLLKRGSEVVAALHSNQYLGLSAEAMLAIFMVDGWPDDDLFNGFMTDILRRAKLNGRRVRVFSEMVSILWAQDNGAATVRLEHLWHSLCEEHDFIGFCAYPKHAITEHTTPSMQDICDRHSRVIA
jgi:hypothetical protein